MKPRIDWDALIALYVEVRSAVYAGRKPTREFDAPATAFERITHPTRDDVRRLSEALRNEQEKWFVADLARRGQIVADQLLVPMLDAGIDEANPSFNRQFIEPCV